MTNAEFSKNDPLFVKSCELGNIKATRRQASKFRNKKGTAYGFRGEAARAIEPAEKE